MRRIETGIIFFVTVFAASSPAATITSLSSNQTIVANAASSTPSISGDGRYIVFQSDAENLVSNDVNQVCDVFLVDTSDFSVKRISVSAGNVGGDGESTNPVISSNGRYVVYESAASNLVANDSNMAIDIFVYDTSTGTTRRVSVDSNGVQGNSHSYGPSISADGEFVVFYSLARNLVANDSNRSMDVFLHSLSNMTTRRVSVDSNGGQANMDSWQPAISGNGRYVVFSSNASNLDSSDTNTSQDIFLHDTQTGMTSLVSKAANGEIANNYSSFAAINDDGSIIAFESSASNLVANDGNGFNDIFVVDRNQATVKRLSQAQDGSDANAPAYQPAVSGDGRFVTFYSYASNIIASDTNGVEDVFVVDLQNLTTEILTLTETMLPADASSFFSSLSYDGRFVAVSSAASNLTANDINNIEDVFLFDRGVQNNPPIADAGNDMNLVLGDTANLDASGSFDPDGNTTLTSFWQVVSAPSGSALNAWTSNSFTPAFTPDLAGVYVISLVVNDGISNSLPDELFLTVSNNLPPVANIVTNTTEGYAPLSVTFDGSGSTDPEMSMLDLTWTFPDGSTVPGPLTDYTFQEPGSYVVTLTAVDNVGNQTQSTVTINVLAPNQAPQIVNLLVSSTSGPAPLLVEFNIEVTDAENDALNIEWRLGDNTTVSNMTSFSHVYLYSGTYQGTVTVSDNNSSTSETFVINVGSDFQLQDSAVKLYVNELYSERGKFQLWTRMTNPVMPQPGENVSVKLGNIRIVQLPFSAFHAVKPGIFIHKQSGIFVKLDFNQGVFKVIRKHLALSPDDIHDQMSLIVELGSQLASDDIVLSAYSLCHKHRSTSGDNTEKYCPTTLYSNRKLYR